MSEKPMEWMTEVPESCGHKTTRTILLIIAVIIFIFYTMTGLVYGLIGVVAFAGISGWMQMQADVIYEFYYSDGEVEITPVYNRTRHGKKMKFSIDEVAYMVKKVDFQEVTKYFCKKADTDNLYTLVLNQDEKRIAIVIEEEPEFVKMMEMKHKMQ